MSFEQQSNAIEGWDCAGDALAEITAYPDELKSLVCGLFEQLGRLADEMMVQQLSIHRTEQQADSDSLRDQIDRLAAVAAELVEIVAEQKINRV
jgi:hypothetical protein